MATTAAPLDAAESQVYRYKLPFVIAASAAGTVIEWYDFYLYGVLAAFFSTQFFPPGNDVAALLRRSRRSAPGSPSARSGPPFFGRIGDLIGRKFTFLRHDHGHGCFDGPGRPPARPTPRSASLPRSCSSCCGWPRVSPSAANTAAPRSTSPSTPRPQARPVHELDPDDGDGRPAAGPRGHRRSPASRCGEPTSRVRLADPVPPLDDPRRARAVHPAAPAGDPAVHPAEVEGRSSTSPWRESFGDPRNRRLILLALFGMTAGQAVVWYQGQFQALFFMQNILGRQVPATPT